MAHHRHEHEHHGQHGHTHPHEEKVEGVEVEKTGHKEWQKKYHQSDMQVLYRRGTWHNWDEMIHWLETQGEKDNELTPGETVAMKEDISKIKSSGAHFTGDPRKACEMADKCDLRG